MKPFLIVMFASFSFAAAADSAMNCDLAGYKAQDGLKAQMRGGLLEVTWQGERREQLRAVFSIRDGQPVVQELAVRKDGAAWIALAGTLSPEFQITSGVRRLSDQQIAPLKELGVALTPEVIEREKWNAFWDAPLAVPGRQGTNLDLPRKPEEVKRAWAKYHGNACQVKT